MNKKFGRIAAAALVAGVGVVLAAASSSYALRLGGGFSGCLPPGTFCLDVWIPVICEDGNIYSNDCYAARACQFDCVPLGEILY